MRDIVIGIDAGTSVIKSVAFDWRGTQLGVAAIVNTYERQGEAGVVQDMARTWADTAATLRELGGRIPDLASRVAAIAVTGQGDGTWLIDAAGEPVGAGLLWLDARAGEIVAGLRGKEGDKARFSRTGSGLAACQMGPQLNWMRDREPQRLDAARTAFHCKDWLYYKLTGLRATDPSEAIFTFGDFRTRSYCDEVIDFLGLQAQRRLLPEIVDGVNTHHLLSAAAAQATGLLEGTPVVLGYVDVVCTALGAGLYDPHTDVGCSIIGSTGMHMRLARSPDDVRLNSDLTGYTMCWPVARHYAQMQSNMAATLNIDWIVGLLDGVLKSAGVNLTKAQLLEKIDFWLAASEPAASQPASQLVYHPYISKAGERGPFVDTAARAAFIGLHSGHDFGALARAVFEGLAMAARDCYDEMGPLPAKVRLTGGAARNGALRRILAGALGAAVQTSRREEAGAAGAAMIAAVRLGIFENMDDCVAAWVAPHQQPEEPADPAMAERLAAGFPAYRQSRQVLRPVWPLLSRDAGQKTGQEKGTP